MKTAGAAASMFLVLSLVRPAGAEEWPVIPARISLVESQVFVLMNESPDWVPASSNLPLGPGDRVWVAGQGRAEVQLPQGNSIRLGNGTSLELRTFAVPGTLTTRVGLERGMATFSIRRLQPQTRVFQVDLPEASMRARAPSRFRSDLFPDGSFQVSVHSGEIIVDTSGGITEVGSGQTLRVGPDRFPHLYASVLKDDFDRWNDLRDIQLSGPAGAAYLPAELAAYAPEFGANGRWVTVPEYGNVWAPIVETGWAPFKQGRWIWWRGEYVWISDEPWGWAPYHFGRWRTYPEVGWIWVPPVEIAVVWNPGAVAWIEGPEFVAWVPLAPGEIFYGHRHYGPWSVNITNVHVTHVQVTNVLVNARVRNAAVVVHKNTFHGGRRAPASFIPPRDPFVGGGRATLGRPPAPPGKAIFRQVSSRVVETPFPRGPQSFGALRPQSLDHAVRQVGARPPAASPGLVGSRTAVHSRQAAPEALPGFSPPPIPPRVSGRGIAHTRDIAPPPPLVQSGGGTPSQLPTGGRGSLTVPHSSPSWPRSTFTPRAVEARRQQPVSSPRAAPPAAQPTAHREIRRAYSPPKADAQSPRKEMGVAAFGIRAGRR